MRTIAHVIIVTAGPVTTSKGAIEGVVFTNDDFVCSDDREARVQRLLVISAGRIVLPPAVEQGLIVSRCGVDVKASVSIGKSRLSSTGPIVGLEGTALSKSSVVEAKKPQPLGFIRWFETSTIGFECAPTERGFKVTQVTEPGNAMLAGLRVGDVITRIDGQQVAQSQEGFRKQLRRGSVQDACDLTVLRDDKSVSVVLDFRDDN